MEWPLPACRCIAVIVAAAGVVYSLEVVFWLLRSAAVGGVKLEGAAPCLGEAAVEACWAHNPVGK